MSHVACKSKLLHQFSENWVAIRWAVVYYAWPTYLVQDLNVGTVHGAAQFRVMDLHR